MCGVSGVFHFNNSGKTDEAVIKKMTDTLVHRGPDDAGIYISPDKKAGLGNRRLKIIDLSPAGHMPMSSEIRNKKLEIRNKLPITNYQLPRAWITFNGEIYNFQELKADLIKKGYQFRSKTDTEVILVSYLEYGVECVKRLNGMFAFAIWDEEKQLLFAARDHLGIKPFYYAIQNGTFYFGSEIKAILAHPDFKKELNEGNISHYLTFSCLPSPYTLFQDVKKLAPAHYLVIKNGEMEEKEYWSPVQSKNRNQKSENRSEQFYIEEIRRLLRDSIKSQMVSDVPFGCFLSGGIDSSTNAALMTEAMGHPVETFSVGSKNFQKYNEFEYSRKMAKVLGTTPHEILIDDNHLEEFLLEYPYYTDDPNGDQVCVPLFWLSKFTRENGVIVIQIGEGSDEIFTGYSTYILALKLYEKWWRRLQKLPQGLRTSPFELAKLFRHPRFDFHKEYLRRLKDNQEPFWGNAIAFGDYEKEKLLTDEYKNKFKEWSGYPVVQNIYREIDHLDNTADFLRRLTYLEIKHRLPELLLARADKMTMAHSLEGRVPFLDYRLVELTFQIPTNVKIKNNTSKYILKKAVEGIIPNEIIWREKKGFATPMSEWFKPNSRMEKRLISIIRASKLRERGILNYDFVERLINAHQYQNVEHNFRLWNLVTLSLWYDYWFS
ncbi:asparagine synthase (glutamine-hydrolyzing) [Candidatus Wolfebacteria bacterium]|nr:asparagine synthase (glutamine-hydrolyzing) [Candidatus Wolfebacteria bacterium]